ncbi:MAG: response regulator transcription factor [Oscillospiraceae bacterium]|nr:response regulator transcription factor [Oscillospiraceae bacterium]
MCYTAVDKEEEGCDRVNEANETKTRILIVDDDPDIRKVLRLLLSREYETAEAADGQAAVDFMNKNQDMDLVILDVMMPGMDGIETCEKIREKSNVPVLFLTAKSAEKDRLNAYQSGGDDFLSKPFSQPELLAKVKSLLRRYQEYRGKPSSSIWTSGNLEVDLSTRMVRNAGENVPLTDTEYSILECLVKNRGRTVTTQELYETVWNEKFLPGSGNTIMVHVLNLRRKIEEVPSSPKIIRTVWGRGYQVE